jgi:hypothetical protein
VLAPQLTKELGLSNIEYGWISQAFLIPYTLIPTGIIARAMARDFDFQL